MPVDLQQELANLVQVGAAQGQPLTPPQTQGAVPTYAPPPQGDQSLTPEQVSRYTTPFAGAPSTTLTPPPPQGDKERIHRTYAVDGGDEVTIYSTSGKRRDNEAFDKAAQHYAETGESLKGFTVLPKGGVADVLRGGFETINQPVQAALPKAGGFAGRTLAAPLGNLLHSYGLISPETNQALQQHAQEGGSALGKFLGSTFDTPEKAGLTAATIATGGLGAGMSLPLQMLRTGVAAGVGSYGASALTGGGQGLDDAIVTGAIASAAQGFTPLVKYTMGMLPISKQAQAGVAKQMMDEVKKVYGGAANSAVLEQMGSNPAGVTRLANVGLDALTGDLKAATQQLKSDILSNLTSLPHTPSKGAQNSMRAYIRDAEEAITTYVGNVTKPGAERVMKDSLNTTAKDITAALIKDFIPAGGKVSPLNKAMMQRVANVVDAQVNTYAGYADQIKPGATLLQALKDSSAEQGFTPLAFQRTLQGYQQVPGTFMDTLGQIARRGGAADALDKSINVGLPAGMVAKLPFGLSKLPLSKTLGTRYAGTVESLPRRLGDAAITATSTNAIKDFLGRGSDDR